MSLLKANSIQIGQSSTATNNFTLAVPASPDGTIKLARGNSGATTADVFSVNASGALTGATISGATINSSTINGGSLTLGTAQNTTSGTAIDFTGIPSWVKRITVMFNGVSTNGASYWLVRLGTSSGITTSGYLGASSYNGASNAGTNSTAGFVIVAGNATQIMHGSMLITLLDSSSNRWVQQSVLGDSSQAYCTMSAGNVSLSSTLDRLRLTTANGTDTFDAGSVNIMYEG